MSTEYPVAIPIVLAPIANAKEAMDYQAQLEGLVIEYLKEGIDKDYGTIPGTGTKKVLLKPGAEKLARLYGIYGDPAEMHRTEDWNASPPLFDYEFRCDIKHIETGKVVAVGVGSCNSWETKYKYRKGERECPACGKSGTVIKGKEEYGGGWLCWVKREGCGAKFAENEPEITSQVVGNIPNPDVADAKNTILKMAKKRAYIDGVISAIGGSSLFTQDLLDNYVPYVSPEDVTDVTEVKQGEQEPPKSTTRSRRTRASSAAPSSAESSDPTSATAAEQKDTSPADPKPAAGSSTTTASATVADAGTSTTPAPSDNLQVPSPGSTTATQGSVAADPKSAQGVGAQQGVTSAVTNGATVANDPKSVQPAVNQTTVPPTTDQPTGAPAASNLSFDEMTAQIRASLTKQGYVDQAGHVCKVVFGIVKQNRDVELPKLFTEILAFIDENPNPFPGKYVTFVETKEGTFDIVEGKPNA